MSSANIWIESKIEFFCCSCMPLYNRKKHESYCFSILIFSLHLFVDFLLDSWDRQLRRFSFFFHCFSATRFCCSFESKRKNRAKKFSVTEHNIWWYCSCIRSTYGEKTHGQVIYEERCENEKHDKMNKKQQNWNETWNKHKWIGIWCKYTHTSNVTHGKRCAGATNIYVKYRAKPR